MKPFISRLTPSECFACVPQTRKGEMIGYLVSGILEVEIGKEKFVLREGESVVFNGNIPHIWSNIGKDEAVSIWIVHNE